MSLSISGRRCLSKSFRATASAAGRLSPMSTSSNPTNSSHVHGSENQKGKDVTIEELQDPIISPITGSNSPSCKQVNTSSIAKWPQHLAKEETTQQQTRKKTQQELDRELMAKMSGLAGDGGEAGIEYEDGQPVAMKRSVRSNMFRYI